MKKRYVIGVSCIGSGVGQSVINSLNLSGLPIKTVGFGTNPFAYGAYDCDTYDYTLSIYDVGYVDDLIDKCLKYKVDLVVPGLDDEVKILSENRTKFEKAGIKLLCANKELIAICRDKERMSNELNKVADIFVKSFNKKSLNQNINSGKVKFPFIAKPRGGFASKGVEIIRSKKDLLKISEDHIIQELAIPKRDDPNYDFYMEQIKNNQNPQISEISIQVVYSPAGKLMGRMISYNKLNNGIPIEIVPCQNDYIWSVIEEILPTLLKMGLVGPLNIQGRLTEKGLKIFEMNPRFTGITGLRALMGFNEVEACVKEWLGIDKGKNKLIFNYNRFGVRQTADKSIPLERNQEVFNLSKYLNGSEMKEKKTLFITGACGYLGQNLINKLKESNDFKIWAFGTNKNKTKKLLTGKIEKVVDNNDLANGNFHLGNVDILLHLGFARPHNTDQQIAESLRFTSELFTKAASNQVPAIINISSQSVYGLDNIPPWNENTPVAPKMAYAQAKYATELLLESFKDTHSVLSYSSLRLGTLAGGAPGLVETDFLSKISRKAYEGKTIEITGGMQQMERFDIRDAVDAIIALLKSDPVKWKPVYNLSSGERLTLKEIAEKTVEIAAKLNGGNKSKIKIEPTEVEMNFGMDSALFYSDMNWKPKYKIEDSIESLINHFKINT